MVGKKGKEKEYLSFPSFGRWKKIGGRKNIGVEGEIKWDTKNIHSIFREKLGSNV